MTLQFFDVEKGITIDEEAGVAILYGTGIPGSGTNDNDAQTVSIGSVYQRNDVGNVQFYQKITGGATTADWVLIPDLDTVQDLIGVIEWQDSALSYITDNTLVPPTENLGDRYILSHDGGAPNAAWDGAAAGDIVEFNGTVWEALTPTTGTFISADDQSDRLYYWGGAAWEVKLFESTTASTGLVKVGNDIQIDPSAAGDGLGFAAGVISVNVDDSTIEISADTLQVKADGINDTHIDFGLGVNQVNAADLPYDNTSSGLTATDTQAAIDELDSRLDDIEGTQTDTLGNTGGTTVTADSVLVDDIAAVTWHVYIRETATGDTEYSHVTAIHDGSSDGVTDATATRRQIYAKTRLGNVNGDSIVVDLDGTGAAQEMRLRISATNDYDVRVIKAECVKF